MSLVELTKSQITLIHLLQNCYGVVLLYVMQGKPLADALRYLKEEIEKEINKLEAIKH